MVCKDVMCNWLQLFATAKLTTENAAWQTQESLYVYSIIKEFSPPVLVLKLRVAPGRIRRTKHSQTGIPKVTPVREMESDENKSRARIGEREAGEESGCDSIGTPRPDPSSKLDTNPAYVHWQQKNLFYMKLVAKMKKLGNQIVVAKNTPNEKLIKGRNKITLLSQEQDTCIGAKDGRVVGARPVKPKEQGRQERPELEKVHTGRGIISLVREAHEEVSEVEVEEKHHVGNEITEKRADYEEEEEDEIREISAKKWTGRYQWSEQMTDT